MLRLHVGWRGAATSKLHAALRGAMGLSAGLIAGLQARQWLIRRDSLEGCYLFDDARQSAEGFLERPHADPAYAMLDAAVRAMRTEAAGALTCIEPAIEVVDNASGVERPVFIIAGPRSGSTWLFDLLSHAPGLWTQGGEGQGAVDGVTSLHAAARGWQSDRLIPDDATPPVVDCLHAGWCFGARDRGGTGAAPARVRLLDKTTENVLRVGFLARACPDAKFVFLHRDARQNISSLLKAWQHGGFVRYAELPGWAGRPWCFLLPPEWQALRGRALQDVATAQWQAAAHWALHDLEMLDAARWTSVDYNDLVAHPRAVIERLCRFLDLEVDDRFDACLARPSTLRAVSATAIGPPSVVKWRSHAGLDVQRIEDATRSTSARLRSLHTLPSETDADPGLAHAASANVRFACPLPLGDDTDDAADEHLVIAPTLRVQIGASTPLGMAPRFRERFVADQPILWSRDALTYAWRPHWAPRHLVRELIELEPGGPLCAPSAALRSALRQVQLVATPAQWDEAQARADEMRETARAEFTTRGHCVVPGVLNPAHVQALARYYRDLVTGGRWTPGDAQVVRRHGWHNESVGRFFHHQLARFVGELVGERVCPSYCYVSAYQQGAELAPHIDRKQCKYTFSIVFDESGGRSAQWPLWFLSGPEPSSVTLEPGQGVLFLGHDLPHWREVPPVPTLALSTLLLHYVAADFSETLD